MDAELESMLVDVHYWSGDGTNKVGWRSIYDDLYAQDEAGLGTDVELLDSSTEAGLIAKIEGRRKTRGRGGAQNGYYFFVHPAYAGESTHRVVVRAADQRTALRLMELIVPEMVDAAGVFAGVHSAKVITREAYEVGRKDLVIIYANDMDTQHAVVDRLLAWKAMGRFADSDFRDPLPVGIKRIARGIGTASQPPPITVINATGGASYGKYLAQVIAVALRMAVQLMGQPLSWPDFKKVAVALLAEAGIDARHPDTIGPRSAEFTAMVSLGTADAQLPTQLVEKVRRLCAGA
jgi:hypothetical protein